MSELQTTDRRRVRLQKQDGRPDQVVRVEPLAGQFPQLLMPNGQPIPAALIGSRDSYGDAGQPLAPTLPPGTPPRTYALRQGQNLSIDPRAAWAPALTPFEQLRNLADFDLARIILEDVKGQIRGMQWSIQVAEDVKGQEEALADKIKAVRTWIEQPDPMAGLEFDDWLGGMLEEILVTDALSMYPEQSRGGTQLGLVQIDGATIRPLRTERGRPPLPNEIAFHQIIRGLPEVGYTSDELWYMPKNRRPDSPYGHSPIEAAIITINQAIRQQMHEVRYYTDGSLPDSLFTVPAGWTPEQIIDYQDQFDGILSGRSEKRAGGMRFVPGGEGTGYFATKERQIQYEGWEWLARVLAWALNVSPMPVAKIVNRATAETMEVSSTESGIRPVASFVKRVIDRYIRGPLQAPEIRFLWGDEETESSADVVNRNVAYLGSAVQSVNEVRESTGLDALEEPWATEPFLQTPTGVVFMSDLQRQRDRADQESQARVDPSLIQRAFLEVPIMTRDELRATIGLPAIGGESGAEIVTIAQVGGGVPGASAGDSLTPPAPEASPPASDETPVEGPPAPPAEPGEVLEAVAGLASVDLVRWRKKSLRLVKAGKRPVGFHSDALPAQLVARIGRELWKADAVEDVRAAFRAGDALSKADPSPLGQAQAQAGMFEVLATWLAAQLPQIEAWAVEALRTVTPAMLKAVAGLKAADAGALAKQVEVPGLDDLDLDLTELHPGLTDWINLATGAGADDVVASLGFELTLTPDQALAFSQERAAELVGMKWVDGALVENPNPAFAISDQLRTDINRSVTKAIKEGWSPQKLTAELRDSLGPWRAQTVARTETAFAYSHGAAEGFDAGGVDEVEILDGPGCLPAGHLDGSPQPADVAGVQLQHQANGQRWTVEQYRQYPIGHPNCVRAAVAVVGGDEEIAA